MRFDKSPISYADQVDLLIQRGLSVPDRARAEHYLKQLNYYRLGAYWLPFEDDHGTHTFKAGVCFDDVLNLYIFDREFRLLVMDAIERIEVSVRAAWAYRMAHEHGPHCHLERGLFEPKWRFDANCAKLESEITKSKEVFIRHFRQQYDEPLPPVWALVEVMTFGQLSQWYSNTFRRADRNAVAMQYGGLDERILCSLLHHLSTVRNVCAHHGRLWNREFTVIPKIPSRGDNSLRQSLDAASPRKIYNTLTLMLFLMNVINPGHHWRKRMVDLIVNHGIDVAAMGFPPDWQDRPLWNA